MVEAIVALAVVEQVVVHFGLAHSVYAVVAAYMIDAAVGAAVAVVETAECVAPEQTEELEVPSEPVPAVAGSMAGSPLH